MSRLSLAWMMSRQNVASSRIRSVLQPWLLAASRASLAMGTSLPPKWVKKSRPEWAG
jgi:hypothetical protein